MRTHVNRLGEIYQGNCHIGGHPTDIALGVYQDSRTFNLLESAVHRLQIDGVAYKEETPAGIGLWDSVNNRVDFSDCNEGYNAFTVRPQFTYRTTTKDKYLNTKIQIDGGSESTIAEWDFPIIKQNVDVVYTKDITVYTDPEVRLYGIRIIIEPNIARTMTHQSIVVIKLTNAWDCVSS